MKYFIRLIASLFPVVIFCLFLSFPAQAIFMQSGNTLSLQKDKKIDETVLVAANDLTIDSEITGDLFCAGKNIVINGNIKGDVLCAGQSIKINSMVDGDVRVAGQNIEINGTVSRNVAAISQNLVLAKFSSIKGDLFFGGQNVDLRGNVGRDLGGGGEKISISGTVQRNVKVTGSNISVYDPAKIGGDFEYFTTNSASVLVSQNNVKGNILKHEITTKSLPQEKEEPTPGIGNLVGKIYWLLTSLILGFTLIYFLKQGVQDRTKRISQKPLSTGLIGLGILIGTPILFVLLIVTVIGAPLAIILLLEYILSLIVATIYPMILVGQWIIKNLLKKKIEGFGWPLLAGTLATGIVFLIPIIGPLTGFIFLCLGLGATFLTYLPSK